MDTLLNWGLLSTANINRALIPPLRESKRNRLLAVGSRTQDSADAYARQWNIPRAHGSYEALLADPEIAVIYNSLPNHLHAEWTIKAVEAGKHVLCEKPIALTVDELDAMSAAAQKHQRVVAEAFMYRHHPQTLKVREIVQSGALGQLRVVRGAFSFVLSDLNNVRAKPEMGGGSIWDVGCYPISYARFVIGLEPLEVFGRQVTGSTGIDETFVGQMEFQNGIHVQFDSSFAIQFRSSMEFIGSEATLNVPTPFKPGKNEKLYLTRGDKTKTLKVKGPELYSGEVEDMADCILTGKSPQMSLADSRANVAVIVALLESAQSGQPIKL